MKPRCLPWRHAVHAGDGLQQVVLPQPLVDVHHLLDRGVEAGEQHVAHDQEGDAGVDLVRVVEIEGLQKFSTAFQLRASLRAAVISASSLVASARRRPRP